MDQFTQQNAATLGTLSSQVDNTKDVVAELQTLVGGAGFKNLANNILPSTKKVNTTSTKRTKSHESRRYRSVG